MVSLTATKRKEKESAPGRTRINGGQTVSSKRSRRKGVLSQKKKEEAISFEDCARIYLRQREGELAQNTLQRYKASLERAAPFFGKYRLSDINPYTVKEYFVLLQTENYNAKTGGKLSYNTVTGDFQSLNTFFEHAVESGWIEHNPFERVKPPRRSKDTPQKEVKALSEEEVREIIRCLEREPLQWRALIRFLIDSGCRIGEAIGLKWTDVNFSTGEVRIVRNAQSCKGSGVYLTTPKSGKTRTIFLNPAPLAILEEWRESQAELFADEGIVPSGFCFTARNGGMMHPDSPTQYLRKTFGRKYGISGLHPHLFRHTMATLTIANGGDVVSVSKKLGHSSPSITLNVYSHANEEALRRANAVLARSIYGEEEEKIG